MYFMFKTIVFFTVFRRHFYIVISGSQKDNNYIQVWRWWWVGVESNFIFGPNLKTKILLGPRPKLNNRFVLIIDVSKSFSI